VTSSPLPPYRVGAAHREPKRQRLAHNATVGNATDPTAVRLIAPTLPAPPEVAGLGSGLGVAFVLGHYSAP